MQSKTGVSLILCAVLIGIFGCDKFSDRSINNQVVDSTQTTNLVKAKLSKGSNSKIIPEEVSRTQAQSQVLKDSNADPAKVEPIISEKSDQKHLKQGDSFSTQAEEEPKAITKKQAHDFCHGDWVKQHYPCKKDHICHYTQEQVYDDIDPYQCKVLSLKKGLAVILSIKEIKDKDEGGGIYYYPVIDLVDIEHLNILDRYKDTVSRMNVQPFLQAYLKIPTDHISHKLSLFNIVFTQSSNAFGTGYWKNKIVNIYQYKNNHLKRIVWGLELKNHYVFQDEKMENRLPKNVKNRCINKIEERLTHYQFIDNKARKEPDLYLNKVIKNKWIRGYHIGYHTANVADDILCDLDKPRKVIKKEKDIIRKQRLNFNGKDYMIPKSWPEEEPFY